MTYRPRPPQKWFASYILPFILIVMIFVWWIYSVKKLLFNSSAFADTYSILNSESWSVEIMISWKSDWRLAPISNIKLLKWDAVRTKDKEASIDMPWNNKVVLWKNTSLILNKIEADNSYKDLLITLVNWQIWINSQRMINPKSKLAIKSDDILITTRGWVFSIEPWTVRAIEWDWTVEFYQWSKIVWKENIWVWQEMMLKTWDIERVILWELPNLRALSDEFKLSSWYRENYWNPENVASTTASSPSNSEDMPLKIDVNWPQKATSSGVTSTQATNEIVIDLQDSNFELEKTDKLTFTGSAPLQTKTIKVNNYALTKYVPWSWIFSYNASSIWWNLKSWENKFKIEAYWSDDQLIASKELALTVNFKATVWSTSTQATSTIDAKADLTAVNSSKTNTWSKVNDEPGAESELTSSNKVNSWSKVNSEISSGTSANFEGAETTLLTSKSSLPSETVLQIISPKAGTVVSWDPITLEWVASKNTEKIIVDDYTLKTYVPWSQAFKYRLSKDFGNLKKWETNSYVVKAYDKSWELIESINYSFVAE